MLAIDLHISTFGPWLVVSVSVWGWYSLQGNVSQPGGQRALSQEPPKAIKKTICIYITYIFT